MRGVVRLPLGFCWSEAGKIEIDPDEHVFDTIRFVFTKFRELGSARQVFLWLRSADIKMPVVRRNVDVYKVIWKAPAYHTVVQILHNPLYAGAYAFGRSTQRTRVVDGRARKVSGFGKPREEWNVLLNDNHPGYISWQDYEYNQKLLLENAHMKKNCARKSARGGRALLTGLMRCGRCGRMMRVFYGMAKGNAHRYQCRGDDGHVGAGLCIGIGGVRIDRAVAQQILEAVSDRAVDAAIFAADRVERSRRDVVAAVERELETARYDASLASRRYELVDPAKRHVARELEARWNGALERVAELERRIQDLRAKSSDGPKIDRALLLQLAGDLSAVWNASSTDTRTKQRLIHILVQEIICELDESANEAVLLSIGLAVATRRFVSHESKQAAILEIERPLPSMPCANLPASGRIGNWLNHSTVCAAKPVMARLGRRCVCAKCASVLVFPNTIPPRLARRQSVLPRRPNALASAWGPPNVLHSRVFCQRHSRCPVLHGLSR
jgi:hypothetical protein